MGRCSNRKVTLPLASRSIPIFFLLFLIQLFTVGRILGRFIYIYIYIILFQNITAARLEATLYISYIALCGKVFLRTSFVASAEETTRRAIKDTGYTDKDVTSTQHSASNESMETDDSGVDMHLVIIVVVSVLAFVAVAFVATLCLLFFFCQ